MFPLQGEFKVQDNKNSQAISVSQDRKGLKTTRGILRLRSGCLEVEVGFKLVLKEAREGGGGAFKSHQEDHFKQWEHQKQSYDQIVRQTFE